MRWKHSGIILLLSIYNDVEFFAIHQKLLWWNYEVYPPSKPKIQRLYYYSSNKLIPPTETYQTNPEKSFFVRYLDESNIPTQ
jgi:hypothetical protein